MGTTMTVTTKITYKYLMGKTKHDLAHDYLDLLDILDKTQQQQLSTFLQEDSMSVAQSEQAQVYASVEGLTEGRIVHYVLPDGEHRPAIIVKVWRHRGPDDENGEVWLTPENGCCNMLLFADSNAAGEYNDKIPNVSWKTSILYSPTKEPGTWHWIEWVE